MTSTTTLRQRFEDLVKHAEAEVAADPATYRWKLAALAALGYAVIFGLLATLIGILGGTVFMALSSTALFIILLKNKLFLLLLVPIWVLGRSLFVRIRAPEGLPVTRKEFPGVWAEIDSLRKEVGALPIHNVVMTPEMNAAVAQTPRLGIFGPYKNTLILGLELLMSLSPQQARAVLAHEFGHLSGQHGRFGTWIYRKRLTWARISSAFDAEASFGTGPIRKFMSWYVPRLTGYSFALARQQEYEADAVASKLTSPRDLASALVQCGTRDDLTKEAFWTPLLRRATAEAEPEPQTYSRLYHHLRTVPFSRAAVDSKIAEAMRVRTGYADTHPALQDRLAALGAAPEFLQSPVSAADAWLGAGLPSVLKRFDGEWLERNGTGWRNRFEYAQQATQHLRELVQKPAEELTQIEAWQVAALTEEFMPDVDPLPVYRAYRAKYPDDRDANFVIGRLMLFRNNDEAGVEQMQLAAEAPMLRERACGMVAAFYNQNGQPDVSEQWLRAAEQAYDETQAANAERGSVSGSDTFKATQIGDEANAAILAAIKNSSVGGKIKTIWLAEKELQWYPDQGVYVVLVKPAFLSRKKNEIGQTLAKEVPQVLTLPGTWYFVPDVSDYKAVAKKVKAVGRALVV
jgi:Zn-dependent protease with chaperone function